MRYLPSTRLSLCLAAGLVAACNPTFAPPTRVGVGTLPEPAGPGAGSAAVGGGFTFSAIVEPRVTLGIHPRLDLDLNALFLAEDYFHFVGSAGLRYYPLTHRWLRLGLAAGVGVGRGGVYQDSSGGGEDVTRFDAGVTGGGYVGLDLGVRFHRIFGIYLGQRVHFNRSAHVPLTVWGYHVLGLHFDILPRWYFTVESGFAWYRTPLGQGGEDGALGPTIIYASTGVRFGKVPPLPSPFARRRPRVEAEREPPPLTPVPGPPRRVEPPPPPPPPPGKTPPPAP